MLNYRKMQAALAWFNVHIRRRNNEGTPYSGCPARQLLGDDGLNFDLSEEQVLLRDLVLRFGADHYDPAKRLAYLGEAAGFASANWQILAETGLLAFALPEEAGGFGGSDVDIITVMEALGRFVAVEPILPSIILGAGALWEAGSAEQRERLLPLAISGERFVSLALFERENRFDLANFRTQAAVKGDGHVLSGSKQMVLGGGFATRLIVAAQLDGHAEPRLFLVDADAPGLGIRNYRLVDGSVASDIGFSDGPAQLMDGSAAALDAVLVKGRLAICAELVGLMDMMFQATLDYLKTRKQFGQPLGSFQALQHRMADCYARLELSRSQLYRAAGNSSGRGRDAAIAGAKIYISESAMHIGQEAVQFHGGIGTTEELLVGQAFKRVLALAALFGDADTEVDAYVRLTGS